MGVAADDDRLMDLLPLDDPLPDVPSVSGVVCAAWPVAEPGELQLLYDIPGQEPARKMKPVTLKVGLMAVYDKDLLPGIRVTQDQSLGCDEPVLFHPVTSAIPDLVVTQDEVQPVLSVEPVQQIKDLAVGAPDVAETAVL
jgi:hypothetical protein